MVDPSQTTPSTSTAALWRRALLVLAGLLLINGIYFYLDSRSRQMLVETGRDWIPERTVRGFSDEVFRDASGEEHHAMVFVPHSLRNGERPPLIVYLNGFGENGSNPIAPLRNGLAHAIWEEERNFPCVVVWPKCDVGDAWTRGGQSTARALEITRAVAERFHTDADRVILTGISSGGQGVWAVAAQHADLFAAIVPISANVDEATVRRVAQSRMPVWAFANQDDSPQLIQSNRKAHRMLLDSGMSPHLTEVSTRGNETKDGHDAWSYAFRDAGLYRWLAGQRRSDRMSTTSRFELVPLTPDTKGNRPADFSESDFGATTTLRTGNGKLLGMVDNIPPVYSLAEIHLEFRCDRGVSRFGVGFAGQHSDAEEQGHLIDLAIDDVSSGGVYRWPSMECSLPFTPVAERCYHHDGWNDLRLRFSTGRIVVELNGITLLNAPNPALPTGEEKLGFRVCGNLDTQSIVRNLRVRRATADESSPPKTMASADTVKSQALGRYETSGQTSLEMVLAGWKRCEELCPERQLVWSVEEGDRFAASSWRQSTRGREDDMDRIPLTMMTVKSDRAWLTTPWHHPRIDLTRKVGLKDPTTLRDFQRVFKSNFITRTPSAPLGLKLTVLCRENERIDFVTDSAGLGYRGIEFDRCDVWRERVGQMDDLLWRGPLLAYRPLSPSGVGCQPERCTLLPGFAWTGGVRCVVVEETSEFSEAQYQRRFWADPLRDFLILKSTVSVDGFLREQIDVNYVLGESGQWALSEWDVVVWPRIFDSISEFQYAGNEWVTNASHARIVKRPAEADRTFASTEPKIPAGTIGYGQKANQWFEMQGHDRRRPLDSSEVMSLASTNAITDESVTFSRGWIYGGLLVLGSAWILIRYLRRRGHHA